MPKKIYDREVVTRTISRGTLAGVGRRLRMLRTVLGHRQYEWADALEVSPDVLNRWEKGKRLPDVDVMIRLCNSTGCTLDFIFRGEREGLHPELLRRLLHVYDASAFRPSPADVLATSRAPSAPKSQRKTRPAAQQNASGSSARRKTPRRRVPNSPHKRK